MEAVHRPQSCVTVKSGMIMATAAEIAGRPGDAQARLLLTELREAHGKLLAAMGKLDELTRGPLPSKGAHH